MVRSRRLLLRLFLFVSFLFLACLVVVGKSRVSVPDDLDDVVDDEEDEAWKDWGSKSSKKIPDLDFKPPDFSKMTPEEIEAEVSRHYRGPSYGFVKLRMGVKRSRDDVPLIAMKWSKVLRTGSIDAKFTAFDLNTIMFTLERGQDTEELKEFVLDQPEAYEMKVGDQAYRRPGDPPLEEVIQALSAKREQEGSDDDDDHQQQHNTAKEEL